MPSPRAADLAAAALWAALPGSCVLCGLASERRRDLCRVCEADLPRNAHPCPRCALPLPPGTDGPCARCVARPPPWFRCRAPWLYLEPADLLVRTLKYRRERPAGAVIAELMAAELADAERPDALIAVPMPRLRRWRRGFNQGELICDGLARRLRLETIAPVRRRGHQPPQAGLAHADRRRNLRAAFEARAPVPRHVAIVDDVATTGATLEALARVLRRAGAERVDAWLFARTPR